MRASRDPTVILPEDSALTYILRNFNSRKETPFLPTLFCEKNTPPRDSKTIHRESNIPIGRKQISTNKAKRISNNLFMRNFTFGTKLIFFPQHDTGTARTSQTSTH